MNLDLRTLQLFVAVVEEQTVAKAAERERAAEARPSRDAGPNMCLGAGTRGRMAR